MTAVRAKRKTELPSWFYSFSRNKPVEPKPPPERVRGKSVVELSFWFRDKIMPWTTVLKQLEDKLGRLLTFAEKENIQISHHGGELYVEVVSWIQNPRYSEQMAQYKKNLEKYKRALALYEKRLPIFQEIVADQQAARERQKLAQERKLYRELKAKFEPEKKK